MHKSVIGLAAAASIGFAALAVPGTATAGCYGCAVGAGVLGGVVAGAIVGNAIANSPPPPPAYYAPPPDAAYGPPPGAAYGPPPSAAYYGPPPAYASVAPGCHWARHRVWVEGVGYRLRTVQVCP
jgi:hypothetical protein